PTLDLVERMANALGIEIYELFINPLSPPEEMERLYQVASKNIERLICDSMERFCQKTAKSLEHIVGESVEKVLADKFNDKK
ncbi:MAG: hypothetical protein LBU85_06270, partial [Treponema sp.]|nr:hypothetical protein [Treponema sp.]